MAAIKKTTPTVVTNTSYCVSTAVSDFVLMLSCVYGDNILQCFTDLQYLVQGSGKCSWKTGIISTRFSFMDIFGLDSVELLLLLESSDLVFFSVENLSIVPCNLQARNSYQRQ